MRRSLPGLLWAILSLYLLVSASAAEGETGDDAPKSTIFNGLEVPPMTELSGTTYKEQISTGYWFVEAFSPWCHHCQHLAPKLQTIYEFYYTSDPLPTSDNPTGAADSLNTFTRYYDFKFARLDCVAFGTACGEIDVNSYPAMILFHNGQEMKRMQGDNTIEELGKFIEDGLEIIRPGSRPIGGMEFPQVGDKEFHSKKAANPASAAAAEGLIKAPEALRPINPDGVSVSFTPETYETLRENTLDPWFIKFYAPWCPHCKRLAPIWTALAREMKGKLNIGEVNCDVELTLCFKKNRIPSYPTLLFFRGPEQVQYEGLRGLGDLVDFSNQAARAADVKQVTSSEFEELEKTEDVIFTYFFDHATTSEDFMALDRLPLTLIGKGKIVKTDDKTLAQRFSVFTFPRLLVSRDGRASVYDESTPQEMRNVTKMRTWMKTVWQPLVPEISAMNAGQLMDDKLVVLGVLSRERKEEFAVAKREIKSAALEWMDREEKAYELDRKKLRDAKQLRVDEAEEKGDKRELEKAKLIKVNMDDKKRQQVAFAWVDGVFWEHWIRITFGVSINHDGEKVIINDEMNRRYWDKTSSGTPIVPSRTSILETLTQIYSNPGAIRSKPLDPRFVRSLRRYGHFIAAHPVISAIGGIVASIFMFMWLVKGRRRRTRSFGGGGFYRLEEKAGLGSVANGKVD